MDNRKMKHDTSRRLRLAIVLAILLLPLAAWGQTSITSLSQINSSTGSYIITQDISGGTPGVTTFSGTLTAQAKADGTFPVISGLTQPLFTTCTDATISNIMLKDITISGEGNMGAICGTANGTTHIYNCGILPNSSAYPNETQHSTVSGSGYTGGLVGLLDGYARVINCFSYAHITGGTTVAGIVGYNNVKSNAKKENNAYPNLKTVVMNCMFYGDITGGSTTYPVYGGNVIQNDGSTAINNYNYYRGEALFDDSYNAVGKYNCSWPAEERNLRRFEYYRSILNSNRRLCAWWITGHQYADQETNGDTALIAKWVLDPSMGPYPVLKKWGRYPSILNPSATQMWDSVQGQWVARTAAEPYRGKKLGDLTVTIKTGAHPGTVGKSEKTVSRTIIITDMDTTSYDYCYGKVQLPYYNEIFGDPSSSDHTTRYYGNYTNKVVTGWKITAVSGGTLGTFVGNKNESRGDGYQYSANAWESGFNYADRHCTAKDMYDKSRRVFAQGGYYYVPEGVTAITIEAYWGDAFYLHGKEDALDHVSVTTYNATYKNYGYAFTPAGTLPTTITYNDGSTDKTINVYDDFATIMTEVKKNKSCTPYDRAVVLVGNFPLQARNDFDMGNASKGGVTFMSADFDMDNEPDFCFPLQWRKDVSRLPIMPVRFDFLPIPELGLTMRHNTYAYAIGIFVPQGHFEITETSQMHTTQFEYMSNNNNVNFSHQQPLILNGGQFEQIVCHGNSSNNPPTEDHTSNIIMGGHFWMLRFTPGSHSGQHAYTRHCAVSVMGGEYPEFYLSGLFWTGVNGTKAYDDNPHCYTNGGKFGIMAGAGMEAVKHSVYFQIDHSIIREFYGGGINANNPVGENVNVTIDNSLVLDKYCGGPKVGTCGTVTTQATNTVFCGNFFGGGNGGTNLYREGIKDATPNNMPGATGWDEYGFSDFNPISLPGASPKYDANKGYHAEFEFEVFNQSNGIDNSAVARSYRHWAQFGTTNTGAVTNTLTGCTVKKNFYGGGNLGNVSSSVTSTLMDCTIEENAFGAGYSATIPSFPVHDKGKVSVPTRDAAGVCHNGSLGYRTDDGDNVIQYTWCYKDPETNIVYPAGVVIPSTVTTGKPVFQYDGKWYCYTTVSLKNLGTVSGNITLTVDGNGTTGTLIKGDIYGGGDESAVSGTTNVTVQGKTHVKGNVFAGGNKGKVDGATTVTIKQ